VIGIQVPADHAKVSFRYDSASHILTILAGHAHDNNVEWDGLRHDSRDTHDIVRPVALSQPARP